MTAPIKKTPAKKKAAKKKVVKKKVVKKKAAPRKKRAPRKPKQILGLVRGLPFEEYLHGPGIGKHTLDNVQSSPADYIFRKENPRPQTAATRLGGALHCLVLEPEKFDDLYIKGPWPAVNRPTDKQRATFYPSVSGKNSIDFWDAFDRKANGRTMISGRFDESKGAYGMSDWDRLCGMAESLGRNERFQRLLDGAETELTNYWVDKKTGILCKNRADVWHPKYRLIADVKTAADASPDGFMRTIHKFRYDVQEAYYMDGFRESGEDPVGFIFVVVEVNPPFKTACRTIRADWHDMAAEKYRRNLDTLAECQKTGIYPGYGDLEEVQTPGYAKFYERPNDESEDNGEK